MEKALFVGPVGIVRAEFEGLVVFREAALQITAALEEQGAVDVGQVITRVSFDRPSKFRYRQVVLVFFQVFDPLPNVLICLLAVGR